MDLERKGSHFLFRDKLFFLSNKLIIAQRTPNRRVKSNKRVPNRTTKYRVEQKTYLSNKRLFYRTKNL